MDEPVEESLHGLIGQSEPIRKLRRLIGKLGQSRWPVLLLGETGTGKEVVARAIYGAQPVGPFVTIDCSSLVGPLMESELFGHSKGAFTGAIANKLGMIELANGGTAFFDEIGELPLDLQAKLLRVLQQKEFRPVGSALQRRSDFRIIAATNRDLAKEVEKGTFRRDLYYRLNVVTVKLAPLRDRMEDVPVLVNHFLERNGSYHRFAAEAMGALLSYAWPGNVRELENCVQQMVAIHTGPLLYEGNLPSPVQNAFFAKSAQGMYIAATANGAAKISPGMAASRPGAEVTAAPIPLARMERDAILAALEYTKGDRAAAAFLLGIGRTTLYRKLKEFHLAEPGDEPPSSSTPSLSDEPSHAEDLAG